MKPKHSKEWQTAEQLAAADVYWMVQDGDIKHGDEEDAVFRKLTIQYYNEQIDEEEWMPF